ncbi:MAG: FliM/FliN family flagellar motor switch protein [Acidobacteriaceae bacterium]
MAGQKTGSWIGKLEAEIARELGQPVTIAPGGQAPETERRLSDRFAIPGARLLLTVDGEELAAILVEGRVLEAGQADAALVRELWSGILTSVAARLGGTCAPEAGPAAAEIQAAASCTLRLGSAAMRIALGVEEDAGGVGMGEATGAAKEPAQTPGTTARYDLLLEVELDASVRFGSREMQLQELLDLGPGDVVELDRHISDPVDLIVGDRIVAHGEVVLVNGNFGLRVTEVAEPVRRLESIRCLM